MIVTVADFYAAHAVDGRACLRGSASHEPPTWIARAQFHGRSTYWLCKRDAFEIELLDPLQDVKTIRAAPMRRTNAWHQAAARGARYPMPLSA